MLEKYYRSIDSEIEPSWELINNTKSKMYVELNKKNSKVSIKKNRYVLIGASLTLLLFLSLIAPQLGNNTMDDSIQLTKSTDGVSAYYIDKSPTVENTTIERPQMSEEELINGELIFKGKIKDIQYVQVDFEKSITYIAVFSIKVSNTYKGELRQGDTIKVMSQRTYTNVQETGRIAIDWVLSQAQTGMNGIFIVDSLDEESYIEKGTERLYLQDISPYVFQLAGECSAFLEVSDHVIYDPSFKSLSEDVTPEDVSLERVEQYILSMLRRLNLSRLKSRDSVASNKACPRRLYTVRLNSLSAYV